MWWIILLILIAIVIAFIVMYNNLVTMRQRVKNAWSQIDVQLQRRFDLIPNLVDTVKGYMAHEADVLNKVTELRSSWANAKTVDEKSKIDTELSQSLKTIMAVAENYPDLKANQNFSELQTELTNTENKISYSRQSHQCSILHQKSYLKLIIKKLKRTLKLILVNKCLKLGDEFSLPYEFSSLNSAF